MKKTLIIGGGGYVGAELISYLINKNFYIYCVDQFIYQKKNFVKNTKNVKVLKIDILDNLFCQKMPSDISSVIILAGLVGDPITKKYPEPSEKINYLLPFFLFFNKISKFCNLSKFLLIVFLSKISLLISL